VHPLRELPKKVLLLKELLRKVLLLKAEDNLTAFEIYTSPGLPGLFLFPCLPKRETQAIEILLLSIVVKEKLAIV
jgi:hypothetical protein